MAWSSTLVEHSFEFEWRYDDQRSKSYLLPGYPIRKWAEILAGRKLWGRWPGLELKTSHDITQLKSAWQLALEDGHL